MAYFDGMNTNDYERTIGASSSDPLPIGFYELIITRNIMKATKTGTGQYIEVEFDVVQPAELNRRKFWDKFNIINKSQDAQRIGREQFSDLLKQVGINNLPAGELDESCPVPDLNSRMVCAELGIDKGTNGYKDSNKCLKYMPSGSTKADYEAWYASKKGSKPAAGSAAPAKQIWGAQPQEAAAVPAATGSKPWGKKA